jgi:hypothetical protein
VSSEYSATILILLDLPDGLCWVAGGRQAGLDAELQAADTREK